GLFLLAWWIDSGLGWRVPAAVGGAAALVAIVVSAYFSNRKTPPPRTRGRGIPMTPPSGFLAVVESQDPAVYDLATAAPGPAGKLPLTDELLRHAPSGDLFGWTQDAGMGWNPAELGRKEFLLLSTQGGLRADDGRPVALGYHTGHWEVGLLVKAAAEELRRLGYIPFAGAVTDPCDGRTQGTVGMFDSLPYRNDAATLFRRLIRSLPTRAGVLGVATCDKGLPAMMMALAGTRDLPTVLVPGGVMLAGGPGNE